MNDFVIGVLGGMGTYATIHLFQQYAEIFSAEKEWDRPRIIIDNRCTMPSRVRAFLYKENVDKLVFEISESVQGLINSGCSRIILACNTSHLFLPYIYKNTPELESRVLHLIDNCVERIVCDSIREVFLLASEGTIESRIYQDASDKNEIRCIVPDNSEYSALRECIEAVKQNKYSERIEHIFVEMVNRYEACILGCTELPILYEKYKNKIKCDNIYDPVLLALQRLNSEYKNV